jgi:hypothetical protein
MVANFQVALSSTGEAGGKISAVVGNTLEDDLAAVAMPIKIRFADSR